MHPPAGGIKTGEQMPSGFYRVAIGEMLHNEDE